MKHIGTYKIPTCYIGYIEYGDASDCRTWTLNWSMLSWTASFPITALSLTGEASVSRTSLPTQTSGVLAQRSWMPTSTAHNI